MWSFLRKSVPLGYNSKAPHSSAFCGDDVQTFYFLIPDEQFEILKEVSSSMPNAIGLAFRRFTTSGLDSRVEACSWNEDLPKKYSDGLFSQIFLTCNGSLPTDIKDFEFFERESKNIIVIDGGRIKGDELEKSYLRVISKETSCKPLYQKIRTYIKGKTEQGLFVNKTHYKNIFYSTPASFYKMVGSFGGYQYAKKSI
jgi:hypothetical protein